MKNRYWVKKVLGGYALMDGDNQLYITTQKIARDDAAKFNKAVQHSVKPTVCPECGHAVGSHFALCPLGN